MPMHLPATSSLRPTLRSAVVVNPLGFRVMGAVVLGLLLVLEAALLAAAGIGQQVLVLVGLPGLVLLGLAGRKAARSNRPLLLTSCRDTLHLEPVGRSLARGMPAETIPLASVQAYTYWSRMLKYGVFVQYHLRLKLADGRVLHLADRPGTRPDDPADAVRLDAVARKLPRWLKPGTPRRPVFYLTHPARLLLWGSWTTIATALVLLGLGHPAASLLLFPAVGYWVSYYLFRGAAELTA